MVLGAGFSHALFSAMPMIDRLGEMVRERLDASDRDKLPPGKFEHGRFEEWFSYISEPQPHLDPEEVADARTLVIRVTRVISEVLSEVQLQALEFKPPKWFWDFLSVLHVLRAQVLTLNYDNFIESGIHSLGLPNPGGFDATAVCEDDILAGLPPCADFPGIAVQSPPWRTYAGNPISSELRRQNTFKLLKLHGSLSWFWLPDSAGGSTLRRWRLPGVFGERWDRSEERRRQELPAHEVFIIPPAALKGHRLREPATRELWRRAAQALREAERVVFVGYSVPLADHSLVGMLSSELAGREVNIQIVNPDAASVESRLAHLGIASKNIKSFAGNNCIADWTKAEVRRLAAESVARLNNDATLTGRELMFADGPRVDRFRRCEISGADSSEVTLQVNPVDEQLTNPLLYGDVQDAFRSALTCVFDVDGERLPLIDYWTQPEGHGGSLMAQLHLVPAGLVGRN
jgi:hypothetical protein